MYLFSSNLSEVAGVIHGFSDDRGAWTPDPDQTQAFWSGLAVPLGFKGHEVARLHQVHGRTVVEVVSGMDQGEGDALITRTPGVLLSVRTADCVPILLASEGEVAAVHAGWRGLVAGVIEATLDRLHSVPLAATIGPCISVEHYEVGSELVDEVAACGVPAEVFLREDLGDRPHVDLKRAAAWKLEQAGIRTEVLPVCTWEDERFPSYRRNGPLSGRMAALIGFRC